MFELQLIKKKLVDVSLIIASLAGLPLMAYSVIRSINLNIYLYVYSHICVYLIILLAALFRKRLTYTLKALSIIVLLFFLALVDFTKTGFQSAGYLWLMAAVIITALYFDLKKSLIVLFFSIVTVLGMMHLYQKGIINNNIDFNTYLFLPSSIIIKILDITMLGLMIAFSVRHVQKHLSINITELNIQKENLEKAANDLREEAEIRRKSELRAINNEKNFRNIFDQSSESLLIVNSEGKIIDFNQAFLEFSGFNEKQLLLMNQQDLLSCFKGAEKLFSFGTSQTLKRLSCEFTHSNNKVKIIECSRDIISYNEDQVLLIMVRDDTEKLEQEKTNFLASIAAEEKEKARFSRELHDGLGPLLSTLKIYLEIYNNNPNDAEIRKRIDETLSESIKSVKEISNNLSPYILENMGLIKAISSLIEKVKFSKKIDIQFMSGFTDRLNNEVEISIYRFISELVNNTIKHAGATLIKISIEEAANLLLINYFDNGIGFEPDDPQIKTKGIGLLNLKSRITSIGGNIELHSSPGKGFQVQASLPINTNIRRTIHDTN